MTHAPNRYVTLTGYLGSDREIRLKDGLTRVAYFWNPVAECYEQREVTLPPREYARLSLATHRWEQGRRITTWHQLAVWNLERPEFFCVRMARKGDRVTVRGCFRSFIGNDGREHTHFIVTAYKLLRIKATPRETQAVA
jgi:single-stranded DNA-binding protein